MWRISNSVRESHLPYERHRHTGGCGTLPKRLISAPQHGFLALCERVRYYA
jgi:hypothetical protein